MARKPYPKLGEVFELTLDGDAPENQPLAMVANDGYNPTNWKHNGPTVKGKQVRRFKLVQKGGTWKKIGVVTGNEVEGQWRNAFKAAYPEPDGEGPVGVHDDSWVDPLGVARFPYVHSDGGSDFDWTGNDFDGRWRWLVPADTVDKTVPEVKLDPAEMKKFLERIGRALSKSDIGRTDEDALWRMVLLDLLMNLPEPDRKLVIRNVKEFEDDPKQYQEYLKTREEEYEFHIANILKGEEDEK